MNFEVYICMVVVAIASIWLGRTLTLNSIDVLSEEDRDKAFEKAKAEYLEWFHKRFTSKAERLAEVYNEELLRENEALRKLNKQLNKEIKKLKGEK